MELILDLLGLAMLVLVGPILLLSGAIAGFAIGVRQMFNLPVLGMAVSLAGIAVLAFGYMSPQQDSAPWEGIATVLLSAIGQGHLLGLPIPYALMACSAAMVALSTILRYRDDPGP